MSHVFHRHLKSHYPKAVRGQGCYIIDENKQSYFDASGGAAVSCLGHSHPNVRQAITKQINELAFSHSGFFTNDAMEELATFLIDHAPTFNEKNPLQRVYFVSGGSEAMETALKMARQYFIEKGESSRKYFIARRQSYHGNTLGALAIGGNEWRRRQFKPLLVNFEHIAPCYAYRDQRDNESESAYSIRVANELELMIDQLGAENVIGFVAEPVVGATAGAVPATEGYFTRIREICDKHNILLILDEVMCGMGRTGHLFAYEHEQIQPDIVTIAKGLGAGYQPIGATLASKDICHTIENGSGFLQHGHTYMGHATACAAALAVQHTIKDENLLAKVQSLSTHLFAALHHAFDNHPFVGDIRGRGLFLGLELVEDKVNKTPFAADNKFHAKIKSQAMKNGLMCYPMGGTIDGSIGDHILLAPPFIMKEDQIDEIIDKLSRSIHQVLGLNLWH